MRKNTVVSVTLALTVFAGISAVAQQAAFDLAVEPARQPQSLTLARAVETNNFPAFIALYREASDAAVYRHVHDLWVYSMTDPIGAFYGVEMYNRFARLYPAYPAYIEDFTVVDSRGDKYYPSAETRRFLLAQIVSGVRTPAPAPVLAKVEEPKPVAVAVAATPAPVKPLVAVEKKPAPAIVVNTTPATATATATSGASKNPPAPVIKPVAVAAAAPASRPDATRGIFLTLLGLLGVGMITLMLHTPSDEEHADHVA